MASETAPQTRKHGGMLRLASPFVVLPRLRRGGRLDGETLTHSPQRSAVKTPRGSRPLMRTAASVALILVLSTPLSARQSAPVAGAAQSRDLAAVKALLQRGADVSEAQGDGMTALHWAAQNGDAELATILRYAGANWRATTRLGGYMPLHLAAQSGADGVIAQLIEAGADVHVKTATGASALMLAAASGNTAAVSLLLERGADVEAQESAHGQTALMFAAARNHADVVQMLLSRGATPSVATKIIDLGALTAAPGEEALQGQRPPAASGPTASPAAAAAPDVAGVTRPYRYNELIGKQGGLTALLLAARQGARQTALTLCSKAALTSIK